MITDSHHEQEQIPGGIPFLWSRFRDATGDDYVHYWLALQATLIKSAAQGLLVLETVGSDSFVPVAVWPEGTQDLQRLSEICESSLEQRCALLEQLPSPPSSPPDRSSYAISYPILVDTTLRGVVALEVAVASREELTDCMEQLQWGSSWLELFFRQQRGEEDATLVAGMKSSFDLLAAVLAEEVATAASMVFVTELATLMKCDRVSLGFRKKNRVRLEAISHSASFVREMNLVRAICSAMEEALLQRSELRYPPSPGAKVLVTRDHEELSRQQGDEAILTVPLHNHDRYYGAIILERPADLPFTDDEARICGAIFSLVAPILEAKRQNERPLLVKAAESFRRQTARLLGRGHVGLKASVLLLFGVVAFFSTATGDYRLKATTTLEPLIRRAIVSPFNGFVKEAPARAGDLVKKGDVLCSLDARDLHLERDKWLNQRSQYQRQRQEAITANDRAKANIIASQLDQADAQLDLVQSQLRRTSLSAPFDGVVVSGDLSQRIDGAVEQGEMLYELAPLNSYRVMLQIDEYRIAEVRAGQTGTLVLPALTGRNFEFIVDRITPISFQKDGKNYFRVEARLRAADDALRPGMEGVGKIAIDRRRLISLWTRDLTDWLRMKLWAWWP